MRPGDHLIGLVSIAVGAVMAAVTRAATSTPFVQALIIAVVSGALTGASLIFSAWLTTKRTEERVAHLDKSLADVKGQLGVAKRRTDKIDLRDTDHQASQRGGS